MQRFNFSVSLSPPVPLITVVLFSFLSILLCVCGGGISKYKGCENHSFVCKFSCSTCIAWQTYNLDGLAATFSSPVGTRPSPCVSLPVSACCDRLGDAGMEPSFGSQTDCRHSSSCPWSWIIFSAEVKLSLVQEPRSVCA